MPTLEVFVSEPASPFHRRRFYRGMTMALLVLAPALAYADEPVTASPPVRGVIVSNWQAVVSAQVSERILSLPFKEGERFSGGDELISFDCTRLRAEATAQKALFEAKAAVHDANERRAARGAAGSLEVEISRAEKAASRGRYEAAQSLLRDCSIKAPFSGRVLTRHMAVFEVPAQNKPLLTILKDDDLEIHVIAPSQWLSWLDVGAKFHFEVDETGQTYHGRVSRLGAAIDPVSQTIRLIGRLEDAGGDVLSGMSGNAVFDRSNAARADTVPGRSITR